MANLCDLLPPGGIIRQQIDVMCFVEYSDTPAERTVQINRATVATEKMCDNITESDYVIVMGTVLLGDCGYEGWSIRFILDHY
jgi:hypothetical protein